MDPGFLNSIINFVDFPYLSKLIMLISGLSLFFFIVSFLIWSYSFYLCFKKEKDISKRNIWLAIIIVGKLLGAIVYLIFESKKLKESNHKTF
jgi:pilus assembly protein TadC